MREGLALVLMGHLYSTRYGCRYQGGSFFAQQADEALGLGDEGVDFGGFAVEAAGDGALFVEGREGNKDIQ